MSYTTLTKTLLGCMLLLAAFSCYAAKLVMTPEQTVVIKGNDISADFAVKELNDIVNRATGSKIRVGAANNAKFRIHVGRTPAVEKMLGKKLLDGLRDEESLVTAKGNDLILVGGGALGTLYAVYDFVEDNMGYRWYFSNDGGDRVKRSSVVTYSGKETRKKPVFTGYRTIHSTTKSDLSRLRNRDNRIAEKFIKGYHYKYGARISGHGFLYFIPAKDPDPRYGWRPKGIKGHFKDHPEYFSMNDRGKRVPDAQLCLSNPATRKEVTRAFLSYVEAKGKGIYMVGSNDNHNTRYCWCKPCMALEKKYRSVGGPLWDYILELCAELKKRNLDGVYVHSLAYKGPDQTERVPINTVFPDNFICDAAFLNSDRTLREVPPEKLSDGTIFKRFENLKEWVKITKHVSYWYYGGGDPLQVYSRMTKEIRELHEAGVISVGACGLGGGYEFGDMTQYLYFSLLRDPKVDTRKLVEEMFALKYGPAKDLMMQYMDELDQCRIAQLPKIKYLLGCETTYDRMSFMTGKELVRWQKLFDDAMKKVEGKRKKYIRNVRYARMGLDVWCVIFSHKITTECPEYPLDLKTIEARCRKAALEYGKDNGIKENQNRVIEVLDQMYNFAFLKNRALPAELAKYPESKVFRFLPPKRNLLRYTKGYYTCEKDDAAASGWASVGKVPDSFDYQKRGGVQVEYYDYAERRWLIRANENPIPMNFFEKDKYKLFRLGKSIIPKSSALVTGGLWGAPTAWSYLSRCYDPSYAGREFEIWISIKVQGPKFFKDDTRPNRIFIDQVFAVDMGVPVGK